jgi:hypothetical protein
MDLAREILLIMENDDNPYGPSNISIPEIENNVIAYHIKLLYDAGLVEAINASSSSGFHWIPTSLTWEGHEFIDSARNEGIWNKAKERMIKETGGMSLDILKALLTQLASKAVLGN